jgi:hypothetical protein
VAAGIGFPHAQAIQIRRRRRALNGTTTWSAQTSYAVTSLAARQATIAAACRYHARDATRVLATLGLSPA